MLVVYQILTLQNSGLKFLRLLRVEKIAIQLFTTLYNTERKEQVKHKLQSISHNQLIICYV